MMKTLHTQGNSCPGNVPPFFQGHTSNLHLPNWGQINSRAGRYQLLGMPLSQLPWPCILLPFWLILQHWFTVIFQVVPFNWALIGGKIEMRHFCVCGREEASSFVNLNCKTRIWVTLKLNVNAIVIVSHCVRVSPACKHDAPQARTWLLTHGAHCGALFT